MPEMSAPASSVAKHELSDDDIATDQSPPKARSKSRKKDKEVDDDGGKKRRCISSACVPCRKRKSKCDGSLPACSACAAVYRTECRYDPASDHRRKGVYKRDIDNLKTRNSTLQTLIQAILNYPEDEVLSLVREIRTCESLDTVAESIIAKENGLEEEDEDLEATSPDSFGKPTFESHLSGKMGDLLLEDGSRRYIGGTSILLNVGMENDEESQSSAPAVQDQFSNTSPITTWTNVTMDSDLIMHLLNMYFTWHYTFFTTLSRTLFYRDFSKGAPPNLSTQQPEYCSPLLVNAMLALGCHFTSMPGSREDKEDPATSGDHFFKEAKRLLLEDDLHEKPCLTTVQALALMSVREAGCGREAKGWVYSGMSFRMACDLGLNLDSGTMSSSKQTDEAEDARRITFWGCFLFDKCWSNYLGRLPQLTSNITTVPKFEVFPGEEAETWSAYTDSGFSQAHAQPSRTRTVARQVTALCEISADLMNYFYNPIDMDKAKGKQSELKKLSEIHQRLETWRRELPRELEPKEGGLPSMLVMHMFFQLLYIHLFRPFLKYNQTTSPLPTNVSPRRLCTQAAATISKLLRLYKRSHGLRQICNIAVYIAHSACTIHLLNLPDKIAKRDIIHGVKHLEEIAEGWLCARRALGILSVLSKKWEVDLPDEAAAVLARSENKFGTYNGPSSSPTTSPRVVQEIPVPLQQHPSIPYTMSLQHQQTPAYYNPISTSYGNSAYAEAQMHGPMIDNRPLPPGNAAEFMTYQHAQRMQQMNGGSSTATPITRASTRASVPDSINGATPGGASPSELFGIVDQVAPREGEWYLRDQAQLATGFNNWNLTDADLAYLSSATSVDPIQASQTVGQRGRGTGSTAIHSNSLANLNGLINENESEWYQ